MTVKCNEWFKKLNSDMWPLSCSLPDLQVFYVTCDTAPIHLQQVPPWFYTL